MGKAARGGSVPVDRRGFLRTLGKVTIAALGLGAVAAGPGPASVITCCRDSSCPACPGADVRYRCRDSGGNACGCICHAPAGNCFQIPGACG
jgi:hypothetical protein